MGELRTGEGVRPARAMCSFRRRRCSSSGMIGVAGPRGEPLGVVTAIFAGAGAGLVGEDLTGATLDEVDLVAGLAGVALAGADLAGAGLAGVTLVDADVVEED